MKRREPRNIIQPLSRILSLKRLISFSNNPLIFPFYHSVADSPPPHIKNLYPVKTIERFITDLEFLLENFEPLSPSFLQDHYSLLSLKSPCFILSFDDGLREVKDVIAPVLIEKGIPAIFFLNNDFIDNRGLFYRYKISLIIEKFRNNNSSAGEITEINKQLNLKGTMPENLIMNLLELKYKDSEQIDKIADIVELDFEGYLKEKQPYLNTEDIKDLISKGFYIGSHSFNHPNLSDLHENEQLSEVLNSMRDLQKRFKTGYNFFAFPFSDDGLGEDFFKKLYSSDFPPDASFGTSGIKKMHDYPHYQRIPLEKKPEDARKYIKTEYFYFLLKSVIGR